MGAPLARAGACVFQGLAKLAAGHAQSGNEAAKQGGEYSGERGPPERRAVDAQAGEQGERKRTLVRQPLQQEEGEPES